MNKCFIQLQQTEESDVTLFLFPFAGGTIQSYRSLLKSGALAPATVYALELPGRGVRMQTPFHLSLEQIKEECLQHIKPLLRDKIVFMGHSMGAIVAYELLSIIETLYPDFQASLIISSAQSPRTVKAKYDVSHMNDEEFKQFIKTMGGIPEQISQCEEMLDFFLQRIRNDVELLQRYQAKNYQILNAPISVIAARDDSHVEQESVLDWEGYTRSSFKIDWCQGGHFYFLNDHTLLVDRINKAIWELSHDRREKP